MSSRTFLIGAGLVAGIALATAVTSAQAQGLADMPGVSVSVEGLVLWRDDPGGTTYTNFDVGAATPFSAKASDLDPDAAAGIRGMVEFPAHSLTGDSSGTIQIGGLYAGDFNDNFSFSDPNEETFTTYSSDGGGIVSPGLDDSNAEEMDTLNIKLDTHLAGAEINYAHRPGNLGSSFKTFIGARYIYFGEDLEGTVFDEAPGTTNNIDDIRIEAENHLVGGQIGISVYHPLGSGFTIGGRLAGGLFANFVERERRLSSRNIATNLVSDTQSSTGFSQMVEFSPKIGFALTDNVKLTLGGMVLWLNDVSDASSYWSNMLNAADSKIRDNESVLFYGASAGLKINLN